MEFSVSAPTPAGYFGNNPPAPTAWGTLIDAQLINRYVNIQQPFGNSVSSTNGEYWLDNQFPYGNAGMARPGNLFYIQFSDTPSVGFSLAASFSVLDQFKTYIMYEPPVTDYQPVPLFEIDWYWNAAAQLNGGVWTPTPPGATAVSGSKRTAQFPLWTNVYINGQ